MNLMAVFFFFSPMYNYSQPMLRVTLHDTSPDGRVLRVHLQQHSDSKNWVLATVAFSREVADTWCLPQSGELQLKFGGPSLIPIDNQPGPVGFPLLIYICLVSESMHSQTLWWHTLHAKKYTVRVMPAIYSPSHSRRHSSTQSKLIHLW